MRTIALFGAFAFAACTLGCTPKQLNTPAGQLFCAIDTGGGGQILAGVIDAAATAEAGPIGGPVAVIATNAGAAKVQADCTAAAAAVGGKAGVPVSPPAPGVAVASVAIAPPPAKTP